MKTAILLRARLGAGVIAVPVHAQNSQQIAKSEANRRSRFGAQQKERDPSSAAGESPSDGGRIRMLQTGMSNDP
jgi:hypothetical protein